MRAEIIMIGTELLLGQIVDTNAAYLAKELAQLGFDVFRKITVGDNEDRIADAITSAMETSDVVITSGGLGPTVDDKTREAVARATNRRLVMNRELLKDIEAFFERRGLILGENNPRQAFIPEGSIPVRNPVGTAPSYIVKQGNSYVMSLPGVPRELKYLMQHTVEPFLRKEFGIETAIKIRILRTAGVGESNIDREIDDLEESTNPTVGLAAHAGTIDIRITAKAKDVQEAEKLIGQMEHEIRGRIGHMIYGTDDDTIEQIVIETLIAQEKTLAVLETNTGGMLSTRLTSVPGGMEVVRQGLVLSLGRIGKEIWGDFQAVKGVTGETAENIAKRLRGHAGADVGFCIVGDESPEVGPYRENAGDSYFGLSEKGYKRSKHMKLAGISDEGRTRVVNTALEVLRQHLLGAEEK